LGGGGEGDALGLDSANDVIRKKSPFGDAPCGMVVQV
jgi:hypothetical protein